MITAPIILFVYNRPEHTRRTIKALQKNLLADQSDLTIFSDGWKTENDKQTIELLRAELKATTGFRSVAVIEREKNMGLAASIIDGVTQTVNTHGKVIVLEDDLETSPQFLTFMNQALELYAENERVGSVHGYVYPVRSALPETFFLKYIDCWGWGTWKRAWDTFEPDAEKLLKQIRARKAGREFDMNYSYHFMINLEEKIWGLNRSWAIRWYASLFLAGKLGLYPKASLVRNIGCDNSGTHTGAVRVYDVELHEGEIMLDPQDVIENKKARNVFEQYFKSPRHIWLFQAMRIKNWIRLQWKKLRTKHDHR